MVARVWTLKPTQWLCLAFPGRARVVIGDFGMRQLILVTGPAATSVAVLYRNWFRTDTPFGAWHETRGKSPDAAGAIELRSWPVTCSIAAR